MAYALAVMLTAVAVLLPSSSEAARPRVAIVETTSAPREGRQELRAAVTQALRDLGAEVVPQAAIRPFLDGCEAPACFVAIGEATGAVYVLGISGSYANEGYKIRLELWDARAGKLIGSDGKECEICTLPDFYRAAKDHTAVLCSRAFQERAGDDAGHLSAASQPPSTNLEPTNFTTVAEESLLRPAPETPGDDQGNGRSFWRQPVPLAGAAVAAAGLVAVGLGLNYLRIDGDPACGSGDPSPCVLRRNTRGVGRGLLVGGLGAALLGGGLIYFGRDETGPTGVGVGAGSLWVAGRF